MKLNKLTSAVSVSLLAVALTACGSDDDAPIINNNTATTPAPAPTPAPTPAAVDNTANIAALTAAFKAAGLSDAKAAELAAANPAITAGGAEFNALVNANKPTTPATNAGTEAASETVKKVNPFIDGLNTETTPSVNASQYNRQPNSKFDRRANPAEGFTGGLGDVASDDPTKQNPYLSNYVLGVEVVGNNKVVALDSTGELVRKDGSGVVKVAGSDSPYVKHGGLAYETTHADGATEYAYGKFETATPATVRTLHNSDEAFNDDVMASPTRPDFSTIVAPQIFTIQEFNKHNVEVSRDQAQAALDTAMATGANLTSLKQTRDNNGRVGVAASLANTAANNRARVTANTAPAPTDAPGFGLTVAVNGTLSGLVVYNAASGSVGNAEGAELGYKVPVFGVEENIYNEEGVAINAVDRAQRASTTGNDANRDLSTLFLAKEVVQHKGTDYNGYVPPSPPNPAVNAKPVNWYVEKFKAVGEKVGVNGAITDSAPTVGTSATADPFSGVGSTAVGTTDQPKAQAHLANPVANNFETRVFGKNYNDYLTGTEKTGQAVNTYKGAYDSRERLSNITPETLQYVQYGRLTNNIDVLANANTSVVPKIYRQFQQHGADNSVDTYFYRGTHATSIAQMNALKAQGGNIQYYGHALTYGVGPKVQEAQTGTVPTAYGLGSSEATIGNFVQANYDIAKGTVKGSIYNFINDNVSSTTTNKDFKKQDLISFAGDVSGNTVIGTADKLGTTEKGTLTASFFGENANELGGSISSITREQGYGAQKWGAVFGATQGSILSNFDTSQFGNTNRTGN